MSEVVNQNVQNIAERNLQTLSNFHISFRSTIIIAGLSISYLLFVPQQMLAVGPTIDYICHQKQTRTMNIVLLRLHTTTLSIEH